jgi:hypothetical protein
MQLEIDRATYLDPNLVELGDGFDAMVRLLTSLILSLGAQVAAMGDAHCPCPTPQSEAIPPLKA